MTGRDVRRREPTTHRARAARFAINPVGASLTAVKIAVYRRLDTEAVFPRVTSCNDSSTTRDAS